MNILFVTSNFPPMDGGIAVFDYHICRELCARGHDVSVLTTRYHASEDFDSQQYFYTQRLSGKMRPTSVEAIYRILYLSVKQKIEVIFFGHFGSTHWLGGVLSKKFLKIPYIILVHGTEFNAYFHRFAWADRYASKVVLKNASTIIVNSQTTKKLVEVHDFSTGRIHIVHPGADPANFKSDDSESGIVDKLGLKNKKVLLSASRLVAKKNHKNVLKALPSVIKKIPNLVYLIIGKGEEEEKLIKLTRYLRLEKYVTFVGYVEPKDMPLYYNICDVFAMPSKTVGIDYESFGIVYAEANACGKPVIGGKSGGVEDAVIDGVTGIIVDPDNIEEISQAIVRFLTDEGYAQKLGGNGRRRVEEELNWGVVGKKIEGILKKTAVRGR
ncbi:glycosyltransferase family 4 protein [Thermodesulfobacteriota bacterium]